MADQETIGTPWRDDELDAIVAEYFSMLEAEIAGQPYVKSRHSAALMKRIGRTHRSVEFKNQNISAVLDELGLPWIAGYKPKRNYQAAIFDAIDRFLSEHGKILTLAPPKPPLAPDNVQSIFVEPPALVERSDLPRRLERLVRKFDPIERDQRNRTLGRAGEAFVIDVERKQLLKAGRQILPREFDGSRKTKGTKPATTSFPLTP